MTQATLKNPVSTQDHHIGPFNAPLVFVEYGDYECPYCAAADPVVEKLITDFGKSMCYVFRHFPLRTLHPHAELAALAAEAAGEQSQFWYMHRLLFKNSHVLSMKTVLAIAEELELDIGQFQDDFQRGDLMNKIDSDVSSGIQSGVHGTPTFFLNGLRVDGPSNYAFLSDLFEEILATPRPSRNLNQEIHHRAY
jgi:protein-disulfide isomerase